MHINITRGDFIFAAWKDDSWKKFHKKVHELRLQGYRKVNQHHDYLNFYQMYKKKKSKKTIVVTIMCC